MASTSNSAASICFNIPVSERLTRENFLVWRAQVLPAVHGARLLGILDGSSVQPPATLRVEKASRLQKRSKIRPMLRSTSPVISPVHVQVSSFDHAAQVWSAVTTMFASQSKSKILQLRSQLSREKKGDSSASAYYTKMKSLADEMGADGKKLEDDDIISYILNGMDSDYNPFVSSMAVKDNLTLSDMYAQLLAYEARLAQQNNDGGRFYSSANTAARGRDRGAGRGRGRSPGASLLDVVIQIKDEPPICQLCERPGHIVHECWYRFNRRYVPPRDGGRSFNSGQQKSASAVVPSYGVDTNWYMDSGATDHITSALDKLTSREPYTGDDQIHAANGKGMCISHIGKSILHSPNCNFSINNVLHVPSATKDLVSVHIFTSDNDVFLEFYPTFFCVKDLYTKNLLLRGSCCDGLYPLPQSPPQVHHTVKPTTSRWHHRLGHPSPAIVDRLLRDNDLSFSRTPSNLVYDACQRAKSHQLPYPTSSSVSSFPLQLVFSDVWGPLPNLWVDINIIKFTWIYLLKNRSDIFQVFLNFQQLVERLFSRKIIRVLALFIMFRVLMHINKMAQPNANIGILLSFGCAYWPNLRPYNNHKLRFRSKQCAFLGYSNIHKGYKCLDISTGRVYISRDVVFDEN
ncbi:hypothetical protein U9M48_023301, partial [Paspalum notatum var. saurae]